MESKLPGLTDIMQSKRRRSERHHRGPILDRQPPHSRLRSWVCSQLQGDSEPRCRDYRNTAKNLENGPFNSDDDDKRKVYSPLKNNTATFTMKFKIPKEEEKREKEEEKKAEKEKGKDKEEKDVVRL